MAERDWTTAWLIVLLVLLFCAAVLVAHRGTPIEKVLVLLAYLVVGGRVHWLVFIRHRRWRRDGG